MGVCWLGATKEGVGWLGATKEGVGWLGAALKARVGSLGVISQPVWYSTVVLYEPFCHLDQVTPRGMNLELIP